MHKQEHQDLLDLSEDDNLEPKFENILDFKEYLINMFENSPIRHGQRFDNGKRWCEVCQTTKLSTPIDQNDWKTKMCTDCQAVWPEHVQDFLYMCQTDEDFMLQFPVSTIN